MPKMVRTVPMTDVEVGMRIVVGASGIHVSVPSPDSVADAFGSVRKQGTVVVTATIYPDQDRLVRAVVHREVEPAAGPLGELRGGVAVRAQREQHGAGDVVALGGAALLLPVPYVTMSPGPTVNVLGSTRSCGSTKALRAHVYQGSR